jgi:hypothetical protein
MHKRRTQFAKRVDRVATAIERRGVRATYGLHDRILSNRASRRRFGQLRPQLDAVQGRILGELRTEGFSVVPFTELFADQAVWETLAADADAFVAETEEGLRREAAGEESGLRRSTKSFLVRRHAWGASIPADDLWLRTALDARVLDLANAYLGLWSKLEYVDLWHTPPTDEPQRVSSQRWHRDFNDRLLLKAFVYLNDVGADSGPFEYVPRSFPGGELGSLWPWWPGYDGYPPDEEFARRMEGVRIETFTAPRGTLILCNTAGFHRGGYATGKARTLATWTYCSPAALEALSERNFTVAGGSLAELSPAAAFALA